MSEVGSSKVAFRWVFSRRFLFSLIALSFLLSALLDRVIFSLFAAALGLALVRLFEWKMQRSVERLLRKKSEMIEKSPPVQREIQALKNEIEKKIEEMRLAYLEFEDLKREYKRLQEEFALFRREKKEEVSQKKTLLSEYRQTIQEQREIIEKKQRYVVQLEAKVHDLMYEIRSLLQLEEPISTALPPIDMLNQEEVHDYYLGNQMPSFDLDMELSRIVDRAEQFTGADHLGSRFLRNASSLSIDLRRLFDQLRDEKTGILFFYSTSEKKILFANNYVKTLLGYSPEKFVNDFPSLVRAGHLIWNEALETIKKTKRMPLVLVSKAGEERKLECEMKLIEKGPFAGNVMGMIIE